jgi:hypothetical protein
MGTMVVRLVDWWAADLGDSACFFGAVGGSLG